MVVVVIKGPGCLSLIAVESESEKMIISVYPVHGMFLGCLRACSTVDQLIPIDTREDRY